MQLTSCMTTSLSSLFNDTWTTCLRNIDLFDLSRLLTFRKHLHKELKKTGKDTTLMMKRKIVVVVVVVNVVYMRRRMK